MSLWFWKRFGSEVFPHFLYRVLSGPTVLDDWVLYSHQAAMNSPGLSCRFAGIRADRKVTSLFTTITQVRTSLQNLMCQTLHNPEHLET